MKISLLFRKLSVITLAFGLTVGAIPGVTSASGSSQFKLTNPPNSISLNTVHSNETFISPQIDTSTSDKIRVIVQLEGLPAAVGQYAAKMGMRSLASLSSESAVQDEQQEVLNEASDQGLNLQVNYTYNTVLNGFEVTIPANEISNLAEIPGVKSIQKNSTWYALPIESSSTGDNYEINPLKQIGADQAWAKDLTGAGLKIGVIDTGVDFNHPDIKDAYKGGYDSYYNDSDPSEEPPILPEDDEIGHGVGYEGTYHGTHVAGTIIGRAVNTESEIVQKGVAYDADLYAYKVLGREKEDPTRTSGSSAQIIDGIERAVKDGMDVINLSLGSDSVKDVNSPESVAINNAVLSGVVTVVANGNAGPGYFTMGSPAGAQLAIAVGAVTSESNHYSGQLQSTLEEAAPVATATDATYDFNLMGWETANANFLDIMGTDPLDVVYVGLGDNDDYTEKDVAGKVVLASRGTLAFVDKIAIAKKNGAKAIVIFNGGANGSEADLSESIVGKDDYINVSLGDSFSFIPTFDLKGTEGRALVRALIAYPDQTLKFTFPDDYAVSTIPGDYLASFSSWGPNADNNLSIKPDFTAPGENILSTYPKFDSPTYETSYERLSGTSMAAPHVAGLALLIKQLHPDWAPLDIRAALANTADVITDQDGDLYDVYQQGAGRVNVANAIITPALLESVEPITILDANYNPLDVINYNSSANFGVVAPNAGVQGKELQLKNTSNTEVTYTASIEWHQEHDGINATLDNSIISAAAGQTTSFNLNLEVANAEQDNMFEGQINLESPGLPALHLPFVIYVATEQPSNGFGIQEVQVTNSVVYPNRAS
ncbi:S8 family serine peptidase [Paenibacillus segetis]|uniref:Minor extracellular protease vpr n=1 Tax=Paenibacillus segetis TaxID=1325360 RepID=A0ABQ1YS88_9BACL|nr:S8 family serine peptidase [Paenibacillus segetis]GGH34403.1 minor extracellular protease vpr [Paenibacillus segetis]